MPRLHPSRRELLPQQQQQDAGPPPMDMGTLVAMLTHLYGLSQQQAAAPGQLQHQDLQNQIEQMQLRQGPEEAQHKNALLDAQTAALSDKSRVDPMFSYLPPEAQQIELDKHYPQLAQNREAASQAKDVADWPQIVANRQQQGILPDASGAAHWGGPAMDYLQGLVPQGQPQGSLRPGQVLHNKISSGWDALSDDAIHAHMEKLGNYFYDLFTGGQGASPTPQPQLSAQPQRMFP